MPPRRIPVRASPTGSMRAMRAPEMPAPAHASDVDRRWVALEKSAANLTRQIEEGEVQARPSKVRPVSKAAIKAVAKAASMTAPTAAAPKARVTAVTKAAAKAVKAAAAAKAKAAPTEAAAKAAPTKAAAKAQLTEAAAEAAPTEAAPKAAPKAAIEAATKAAPHFSLVFSQCTMHAMVHWLEGQRKQMRGKAAATGNRQAAGAHSPIREKRQRLSYGDLSPPPNPFDFA